MDEPQGGHEQAEKSKGRGARSGGCTLSEVTRFNEALDEPMIEATVEYSATIEETCDHFLGVLGHDLRNDSPAS
jgi:hypothetical protein